MASKSKFKVGDIVQLLSGGPNMTITFVPDDGQISNDYTCQWFAGNSQKQGRFPEDALKIAPPKTK